MRIRLDPDSFGSLDPDSEYGSGSRSIKFGYKSLILTKKCINFQQKVSKFLKFAPTSSCSASVFKIFDKNWKKKLFLMTYELQFVIFGPGSALDPDPDWTKLLDPDPDWRNPDPHPCIFVRPSVFP